MQTQRAKFREPLANDDLSVFGDTLFSAPMRSWKASKTGNVGQNDASERSQGLDASPGEVCVRFARGFARFTKVSARFEGSLSLSGQLKEKELRGEAHPRRSSPLQWKVSEN